MKWNSDYKNKKFEWWHTKKDGTLVPVEIMMTSILMNDKKVFHIVWRDISERKQFEHELEYLSYHDQLTGLYNRRFYQEELNRMDTSRNLPITIVMGDVNGLKLVNDSFGHAIGDELLKKVAEVLKEACRYDDIVARLGGDEFVILLPKTNIFEADQIIKRINTLAALEKVASIDISVSFGYDSKNDKNENIQETIKRAEDHMYKKKLFESPSMRGKTIKAIINTLHEKNKREELHSRRVSKFCENMGRALNLAEGEIQELKTMGLLHDIGKIAIDESILNKPGKLTESEWDEIKRHPEIGYRILSTVNDMSEMADFVLYHHERWDGTGYPKGLKKEEIPFLSRVIAIADAYDAMTSDRSYREALPEEVAISQLQKNAGTQFDPELVPVFVEKVIAFLDEDR
jgi:diguanylate cyclase (GGDEF)-like protein